MGVIPELVRARLTEQLPTVVERDDIMEALMPPARFNRVHIITGMRRSGKTFYLFQHMGRLIAQGAPRSSLFYFDFSDDRLPQGGHVMDEVLDEYWRQVPTARTDGAYLFLDEVQDCEGWQGFCRRVAEDEKVTLVVTGSSSKVSSSEIATAFRGRSHTHEMLPLSFSEFLRFHEEQLPASFHTSAFVGAAPGAYSPAKRTALEALFDRYLTMGGFPAVQDDTPSARIEVLQGYVRDVVARDVAERLPRRPFPSPIRWHCSSCAPRRGSSRSTASARRYATRATRSDGSARKSSAGSFGRPTSISNFGSTRASPSRTAPIHQKAMPWTLDLPMPYRAQVRRTSDFGSKRQCN